jgi:hypothetical protein
MNVIEDYIANGDTNDSTNSQKEVSSNEKSVNSSWKKIGDFFAIKSNLDASTSSDRRSSTSSSRSSVNFIEMDDLTSEFEHLDAAEAKEGKDT